MFRSWHRGLELFDVDDMVFDGVYLGGPIDFLCNTFQPKAAALVVILK